GNGARFLDQQNIIEGYGKWIKDGLYKVSRTDNNHEFFGQQRKNSLNYAPVTQERSSSNPYNEYTMLARREGKHIQFVWENAIDYGIFPGMPCKFVYEQNNALAEVEGVVLDVEYHYVSQSAN